MQAPATARASSADVTLRDFASLPVKDRSTVVAQVAKLERKTFPSNEHWDYDVELKKKNVGLIIAFSEDGKDQVAGFLVYQRMKRLVWLHKLCVIEAQRKKGIGKALVTTLRSQMKKGGCESIYLWVDEHRTPARTLYESYGFQQIEYRGDYYSTGRAGLKMEFRLHNE